MCNKIAQAYYSYKWYSQASSDLQEKLPCFNIGDSIDIAQQKYMIWIRYYAYTKAEHQGRVVFRDAYVPVEERDEGHEYQIKRCEVGIKMAHNTMTLLANHISNSKRVREEKNRQLQKLVEFEEKSQSQKVQKANKQKSRKMKTKKSQSIESHSQSTEASYNVEEDMENIILEIQAESNASEIKACMDVAELILRLCPDFCARDENIPGSIDYVAMMEILLLNQECCKSRYGNDIWNKRTFLKNYNPMTLASSVYSVDAQYRLLQHIKRHPEIKVMIPHIDEFVQFIATETIKIGPIRMRAPTEQGLTSPKEFDTFFKSTMQEVIVLMTYNFYLDRKNLRSTTQTEITDYDADAHYDAYAYTDAYADVFYDTSDIDSDSDVDSVDDIEEVIAFIVHISILQTSKECLAHRGNRMMRAKNEQCALNVLWIVILCIQNIDTLLHIPSLVYTPSGTLAKENEKRIPFFENWKRKFDQQPELTKSNICKLIRDLNKNDRHLLHSIMEKPRSRCCVGHLSRTLNSIRVKYTGEEDE